MNPRDQRIGQFVQRMRGEMSQKQLAEAMRKRDWKWTQTTVWNIEKGERPLRFAEAEDLVQITGNSLFSFMGTPKTYDLRSAARKIEDVADEIWKKLDELRGLQIELAMAADTSPEAIEHQLTHDHIVSALEMTPAKIIDEYERNIAADVAREAVLMGASDSARYRTGPYGDLIGLQANMDQGFGEIAGEGSSDEVAQGG